MLYLAEVQRKGGGLLGGSRSELKLLACQRTEQSWSAVSGDEIVASEEAGAYNQGALVLVDLNVNKQVQRVQEAGRPLVSILQGFSRLQERFQNQEDEIEQWKQSLAYQSQELNRREMEMEARWQEFQQMEEDFEQLEQQRREFHAAQVEMEGLRQEFDRKSQELEGAWAHLRGEMSRLEEQQADANRASGLDLEQVQLLQGFINRLTADSSAAEVAREQLNWSVDVLNQKQDLLTQHWKQLEQQQGAAQHNQESLDHEIQDLHQRWQEWHRVQESLEQARADLKGQQQMLSFKQDLVARLTNHLQTQAAIYQQLNRMADSSDRVTIGQRVDMAALEKMALETLQMTVHDLERDLEKLYRFVEGQEEELDLKRQELEGLKAEIEAASEFDRLNLENELADEQDAYRMLYETLVGQRRNLREREYILKQHRSVLRRRLGQIDNTPEEQLIDLGPVIHQLEGWRQQQTDELKTLTVEINQFQANLQQAHDRLNQQAAEQETRRNELKQWEQDLQGRRAQAAELWGRVQLYREILQPIQDRADQLRQGTDAIGQTLAQILEHSQHREQTIIELQQTLHSLVNAPQLAIS